MWITRILPDGLKHKVKRRLGVRNVKYSLETLKQNGYSPASIIDVGAFDTEWSREIRTIFPDAKFYLFEPLPEHAERCRAFAGTRHFFAPLAMSNFEGTAEFKVEGTNSSFSSTGQGIKVPVSTLDAQLSSAALSSNSLLKIDVQGFEKSVLEGAKKTLERVEVIIVESSLIKLCPTASNVEETLAFLREFRFRLYDICTFWHRPIDGALWQVDLILVRDDSPFGSPALGF